MAFGQTVAALRVTLGADITKFKTGMAQARTELQKTGSSFQQFASAHKMFVGIGLTAVTASVVTLIKSTAKWADEIAKTSKQLGVSTEFLSRMDFTAQRAGASMGDITTGIGRLAKAASDAQGGMTIYREAFKDLKVDFEDANGELKTTEVLFMDVIKGLGGVANETKRLALARELLGRGGGRLIPLINEDIDALWKLSDAMNNTLTAERARQAEEFADSMTDVKTAFKGLAVEAIPAAEGIGLVMETMAKGMTPALRKYMDSIEFMREFYKDIWNNVRGKEGIGGFSPNSDFVGPMAPVRVPVEFYIAGDVGTGKTGDLFAELFRVQDITGLQGEFDKVMTPILKDSTALKYELNAISKEYAEVNDMVLISTDVMKEWADQARYATDLTMDGLESMYRSLRRGVGFWDALAQASTRFTETLISNFLRVQVYGLFKDLFSGGVMGGGGGGMPILASAAPAAGAFAGPVTSSAPPINISISNGTGMPLDVGSVNASTGANSEVMVDIALEGGIGRMIQNGKMDKLMSMYGCRRQWVSR